ncbi:hypothetical protein BaRGS_00002575 [Batillaria attramentaria]|uniref:Uncharacterized protein n=1 Tax=Batillaria attramentaria TaxID=370345 RepID=A0ABD0M5N5_9CAEN
MEYNCPVQKPTTAGLAQILRVAHIYFFPLCWSAELNHEMSAIHVTYLAVVSVLILWFISVANTVHVHDPPRLINSYQHSGQLTQVSRAGQQVRFARRPVCRKEKSVPGGTDFLASRRGKGQRENVQE